MGEQPENSFFRDICLHTGMALIASDRHLRIQFWNQAAGRIFGGSAEGMTGQPLMSVVPHEHRDLALRLLERALHRGEHSMLEFPHRSPTGDPMYLAVTISPVIEPGGQRTGVSVCVRDVTRRMDLERAMAQSQKMSALGSMAGEVAHHFNNLIGGIITSIDFAQNSDDAMQLRRVMRTTATALARANQLTLSLLAFAEGDRADGPCDDPAETAERFITSLQERLADQNIQLETELQPIPALVPARRILTILERLTTNAIEAMPSGGLLRIELVPAPEQRILLRVSDSGIGIPEGDMAHVFEPFFTTKGGDAQPAPHAGLGLAVVHGIVRDLRGSVTIAPRPGGGTVCSVLLPITQGGAPPSH